MSKSSGEFETVVLWLVSQVEIWNCNYLAGVPGRNMEPDCMFLYCIETSRMLLDVWIVSMKWSAPTRKITARTLACAVAVAKSSILYSKSKELNFILKMLCLRQSATRANNVCPCGRGRQKAESLILYSKCLPATISNGISALTLSSVNSQFYYSDTVQRAERMRVI